MSESYIDFQPPQKAELKIPKTEQVPIKIDHLRALVPPPWVTLGGKGSEKRYEEWLRKAVDLGVSNPVALVERTKNGKFRPEFEIVLQLSSLAKLYKKRHGMVFITPVSDKKAPFCIGDVVTRVVAEKADMLQTLNPYLNDVKKEQ